ncbi:hypothetical protein BAZSYMA_ACONTIG15057_2 [Bathymodiolus azoricus thioautotrophic gill symbiont]|uniref:Uncharacterized protein n=1 Tax=Bathymodiolus azoricus thioautotrophic gill symbiont TaxID=235205 RepID=A0A1H6K141_9GAMM|nr:hypothetical protein BAZSYMA_ACONTIG15057_2 [Bathymodiolus azoricus thioautotrophic gill symbiont]
MVLLKGKFHLFFLFYLAHLNSKKSKILYLLRLKTGDGALIHC